MNKWIKSDLLRYSGEVRMYDFCKTYLLNPSFRFQVAFRLVKSSSMIVRAIGRILWLLRDRNRFQISRNTNIGYGLYIGHNGPVIINDTAILGNNVNLSQFVTIGSNKGAAAVIGDEVYIGPNVCIVNNVNVGSCVTIDAGAVVVKDVPNGVTVAGNPAKIISTKNHGEFIKNKFICS